jgi:NACalpha-BTF3-like transcription factor
MFTVKKNSSLKFSKQEEKSMEIKLEAVEKVMELAGVDYYTAKEALENAEGDIDKALEGLTPNSSSVSDEIKDMIDKLKAKVKEGNVDRIQIRKDDEVILKVPVNVGIIGGIIGVAAAPWALIAGTIAAFGFGCKLEIVKKDGSTDEIV